MDNIRNLKELLKDVLGETKEVQETKICSLTKPGDNYGSLMLQLDIILNDKNTNKQEILALVAKKIPPSEYYQKIFKIQETFKKEVGLYITIVPVLKQFVKEITGSHDGLDLFPKYYASRFNLNKDDGVVDEDGVLILENLKISGYLNLDRKIGFDMDAAKFLLKNLAKFHAVPLALRLQKPAVFAEKIKPFCFDDSFTSSRYTILNDFCRRFVAENPQTAHLASKIKFINPANKRMVNDMFGTLIHFDLWTNNVMVKFDNGKITGSKLVDFQVYHYGSPASDLFFFLWTSVQDKILKENIDDLIKYYHEHFVKTLKTLNCDPSSYTIESLYDEIKFHSKFEFGHVFYFTTFVLYNDKKEGEGYTPEDSIKSVTQRCKEKGWFMILECEKRGWISLEA